MINGKSVLAIIPARGGSKGLPGKNVKELCGEPSQQCAKYFYKKRYGNIINISSVYGVLAPRFEIYENTTKQIIVILLLCKN